MANTKLRNIQFYRNGQANTVAKSKLNLALMMLKIRYPT